MRSGRSLSAATLFLVAGAAVGGCAVGDGLRVEGTVPAPTPSSSLRVMGPPKIAAEGGIDLATLRHVLLIDSRVEPDIKDWVRVCPGCVRLGPSTDVVPDGGRQQIATVSLHNGGAYAAFLIGTPGGGRVGAGPGVLWSVEGDDMKVSVGKDRTLLVESVVFGPTDPACCPKGSKIETYKWNGTRLVSIGTRFIPGG